MDGKVDDRNQCDDTDQRQSRNDDKSEKDERHHRCDTMTEVTDDTMTEVTDDTMTVLIGTTTTVMMMMIKMMTDLFHIKRCSLLSSKHKEEESLS